MAGFNAIIGHEQIIAHLSSSMKNNKISHAYIFNGEHGSGKKMLVRAFVKALQCEAGYGDCCDMCRSCHKVDTAIIRILSGYRTRNRRVSVLKI